MNNIIKEQNKRDLKRYRLTIAAFFVASLVIAIIVGITTVDHYVTEANSMNVILDLIMPKSIEGESNEGEAQYTYGMVFYREKNKDYDPVKDEPITAFKYYHMVDDKKVYLEDGVFYPADYYNKDKDVSPVPVYVGFYLKGMENWKAVKNVIKVVAAVIVLALLALAIYLWYVSWRNREMMKKSNL